MNAATDINEKKKEDKLGFFTTVKFLNKFLDRLHLQLVLFYLGWLFDTLSETVAPILLGIMINQIVYYQNLSLFIKVALAFFGLSVFSSILYFLLYSGRLWSVFTLLSEILYTI